VFHDLAYESRPDVFITNLLAANGEKLPPPLFKWHHPSRQIVREGRRLSLVPAFHNHKNNNDLTLLRLANGASVKIRTTGGIELQVSQHAAPILFSFADELRPIHLSVSGNEFATSHVLPIVDHWDGLSGVSNTLQFSVVISLTSFQWFCTVQRQ
jgi:hypothetical protein